jgi:hypothetical protein
MANERCEICGRFIGYKEFSNDEIKIDFTPDTEFTTEEIKYTHKKCLIQDMERVEKIIKLNE